MQTKRSKNWIALVLGGLMLAAYVTLCTMAIVEVAYPRFLLVAETQNADGIALDTAFILTDTMERGTDPEELLANITFEPLPGHGYTIEPAGDFTYRLVPGGALLPGGQLDVQVYDQHFQFAVQNRLRVLECFPATGSKNVPVNTGIEIVFNTSDVTREAFAAALSIAPGVEGRVRVTGNRYIFVPTSPLAYNKTYTVWLNENLTSENGAMMTAGYKFTFKTQETAYPAYANSAQFQMSGNGISVNSLASETPLFQAYIAPELASSAKLGSGGSVSATVLAFSGWEDYASQLSQNTATGNTGRTGSDNNIVMDTSGLAQAASFDIEPVRAFQGTEAMDTNQWMLPFPEALPEGWYAVEFKLGAATRRMFLQVSDLSVFYMWSAENFLAWVNDAATGQPVSGAQVALSGDYSLRATTGEDGTAQAADAVLPAVPS